MTELPYRSWSQRCCVLYLLLTKYSLLCDGYSYHSQANVLNGTANSLFPQAIQYVHHLFRYNHEIDLRKIPDIPGNEIRIHITSR